MDYIMASAAYPGLKRPEIDGKKFLDGGLVDNVPVRMLLSRQKDNVIVVNIGDTNLVHDLDPHLNLIYIRPLDPLGRAFAFQPGNRAAKNRYGLVRHDEGLRPLLRPVDVLPQRRISAAAG